MDTRTRDVKRAGRSIQLSVKEYDLLNCLMRGSGRVLERQEIMRAVWGENFYGDDNLLDVYIRYLRKKVESKDAPTLIHTVRGVGFILREESNGPPRPLTFAQYGSQQHGQRDVLSQWDRGQASDVLIDSRSGALRFPRTRWC